MYIFGRSRVRGLLVSRGRGSGDRGRGSLRLLLHHPLQGLLLPSASGLHEGLGVPLPPTGLQQLQEAVVCAHRHGEHKGHGKHGSAAGVWNDCTCARLDKGVGLGNKLQTKAYKFKFDALL